MFSFKRFINSLLICISSLLLCSCLTVDNPGSTSKLTLFQSQSFEQAGIKVTSNQEFQFASDSTQSSDNNQLLHLIALKEAVDITIFAFEIDEPDNLDALAYAVSSALEIPFTSAANMHRRVLKNFDYPAIEYRGTLDNRLGQKYYSILTLFQTPNAVIALTEIDSTPDKTEIIRDFDSELPVLIHFNENDLNLGNLNIPTNPLFTNGLGLYYHENNNLSKAAEFFKRAVEIDPKNPTLFLNAITTLLITNKVSDTLALFQAYRTNFPENVKVQEYYANALIRSGEIIQGSQIYDQLYTDNHPGKQFLDDCFGAFINAKALDQGLELASRWAQGNEGSYVHFWQLILLREIGRIDQAYDLALLWKDDFINEPNFPEFFVDLLLRKSAFAEAIVQADEMLQFSSNLNLVFYKAVAYSNLGQYVSAKQYLEEVISANPTHASAKQFLAQVTSILGQTDTSLFENEIKAVPLNQAWLDQAPEPSPEYLSQKGALGLEIAYALDWKADDRVRITTYKHFQVRDDSALAELKETILTFDPLNERIYINELTVYDAEGNVVGRGNISQYYQTDPNHDNMLTTEKNLHLPIPNLIVGGSYQLTYTRERSPYKGHFGFELFQPSGIYPRKVAAIQISGDIDQLSTQVLNASPLTFEEANHKMWIFTEPPLFENHPFLANPTDYIPSVFVKTNSESTWESIGLEYWNDISELYEETFSEFSQEVQKIQFPDDSIESKVKAVADYMAKQYTYTALNFGLHATIPHDPKTILKNKFGDCKDLTLIMHHYLKALDIESYPALVQSGGRIIKSMPSLDQFNHVVLFIPDLPFCPIVDPTDPHMPIGLIPRSTTDNSLLIIKPSSIEFLDFPHYAVDSGSVDLNRTTSINLDGSLTCHESVTFKGTIAVFLRDSLADLDPSDHSTSVLDILNSMGANLPLASIEIKNLHQPQDPLVLNYEYVIDNTKSVSADTSLVSLPASWSSALFYHQRDSKNRLAPIQIRYPITVRSTEKIEAPASWSILPDSLKSIQTKSPFGLFEMTPHSENQTLSFSIQATLNAGQFPASQYPQLADYLINVYQKSPASILFKHTAEANDAN